MFLLDISPLGGAEIFLAVVFFFIALSAGVFAFLMIRKSIKIAIRMAIVAVIAFIAVVGSIALWLTFKPRGPVKPTRPPVNQTR